MIDEKGEVSYYRMFDGPVRKHKFIVDDSVVEGLEAGSVFRVDMPLDLKIGDDVMIFARSIFDKGMGDGYVAKVSEIGEDVMGGKVFSLTVEEKG